MRIRRVQTRLRRAPQRRRPQLVRAGVRTPRVRRRLYGASAGGTLQRFILIIDAGAGTRTAVARPIITGRALLIQLLQQRVHLVLGRRLGEYGRVAQHATVQRALRL